MSLSIGKLRGLQQLAGPEGVLTVCAIDHRESLKRALEETSPGSADYDGMVNFKLDLCRELAPHASAVLLDPVYGDNFYLEKALFQGRSDIAPLENKMPFIYQQSLSYKFIIQEVKTNTVTTPFNNLTITI